MLQSNVERLEMEASRAPDDITLEKHGSDMLISIVDQDTISEHTSEGDGLPETVYSYVVYRCRVPFRSSLYGEVSANVEQWLNNLKSASLEQAWARLRERRDKLLLDSDSLVCLDRLGLTIPNGSTFTAWLSFLKRLGEALTGSVAQYRQALRDLPNLRDDPYIREDEWPSLPV